MSQRVVQVDAFTDRPFRGNPAAVCVTAGEQDEAWMGAVAREMNLSETAFLHPEGDGWRLRWFTPVAEVELCGHATLASAHVLWEEGRVAADAGARFHTRSGLLTARRDGDWIELDFPATPATPLDPPPGLLSALGIDRAVATGSSRFDWLIEVETAAEVRALSPDFSALRHLPARGVIVTARSDEPAYDFISRFFGPAVGVDEDPVTGSAHCALAPWWAARLGRNDMSAFQASARGGELRVGLRESRVLLRGRAVTVLRGELVFPPEPRGTRRNPSEPESR
jgi:PhzF family phenazine biosynthesis protein